MCILFSSCANRYPDRRFCFSITLAIIIHTISYLVNIISKINLITYLLLCTLISYIFCDVLQSQHPLFI